jgi:hypothetical protein
LDLHVMFCMRLVWYVVYNSFVWSACICVLCMCFVVWY